MFWIPETNKPPLIEEDAEKVLIERIQKEGIVPVSTDGFELIRLVHQPLGRYLNGMGRELNSLSAEGPWPARALKLGACLTMLAYYHSGYEQHVDEDAVAAGSLLAELGGIPETFAVSVSLDPLLVDFNRQVLSDTALRDEEGGFTQVVSIGSGVVRHYLQQAIAA
jgi:hypothetical protein